MTGLIVRKQFKEMFASKSSVVLLVIIIAVCGIGAPIFSQMNFIMYCPLLALMFIAQNSPSLFVDEKDNRTLETLVTLPVEIKKILYAKVFYAFLTPLFLFLISFALGLAVSFAVNHAVVFTWRQIIEYVVMFPLTFLVFAYQSAYLSLKSNDSGACALTLTFVSILYNIPAMVVLVFVLEPISTTWNLWGLSLAVNLQSVTCAYIVILVAAFVVLHLMLRKYFNKTAIFTLLRS